METPVSAKAAFLCALRIGAACGADLITSVQTWTGISIGQGSAYPALRALEEEGLATSWEGDPTPVRGGRARRYYKLTSKGKAAASRISEVLVSLGTLITPPPRRRRRAA